MDGHSDTLARGGRASGESAIRQEGSPQSLFGTNGDFLAVPQEDGGDGFGSTKPFSPAVFLRYRWMIAAIVILGTAATAALIWLVMTLKYVARAQVEIQPHIPIILEKTPESGTIPFYQSYLNTQVSIIGSSRVIGRVLDDEDVQNTWWYDNPERSLFRSTPLPANVRLRKSLKVSPIRNTHIINVSFEAEKPNDASEIANAVVQAYRQLSRESYDRESAQRYTSLLEEQSKLSEEVNRLGRQRRDLAGGRGTGSVESLEAYHSAQQAELASELRRVVRAMTAYERDLARLSATTGEAGSDGVETGLDSGLTNLAEGSGENSDSDSAEAVVEVTVADDEQDEEEEEEPDYRHLDMNWVQLRDEHSRRSEDLETALERLGDDHPDLREYQTRLKYAERRLARRERELKRLQESSGFDGPVRMTRREQLEDDRARAAFSAELLRAELQKEVELATEAASLQRRLLDYDAEVASKKKELQRVTDRINALDIESKVPGRVQLVSEAAVPTEPSRDRRVVLTVMALFGWLGAGFGLAYLRFLLDASLSEPREVVAAVHVPFLGQLPQAQSSADLLGGSNPLIRENIRIIRTSLLERDGGDQGCTVLVTSPGPQTGKTTFALLLAKSLGQIKKRVLLVDVDLRRMGLSEHLGVESTAGVVDLLRGTAALSDVVIHSEQLGVDMVSAGNRVAADDSELLADGAFSQCLMAWREQYDYVLLDSTPVLPVADARMLASQVDGTILTLRASRTPRSEAMDSMSVLNAAGARLYGTVLNGIKHSLGSYYKYGSYYHDYYLDTKVLHPQIEG